MMASRVWSVAALIAFLPAAAGGASGTDVVQVANGDHFTGDVSRLERGTLSFRTDAAGTIPIAWAQVVRLTSTQDLDVETTSGARFAGSITSPSDGHLVVQGDSGTSVPLLSEFLLRRTQKQMA